MADKVLPRRFAFVFPMASGHINPSLAVARALVTAGHEVHYLCREQMRLAIEDTGASFHSDIEHEPELYNGREPDILPALMLKTEYGLEDKAFAEIGARLRVVALELVLPGVLRWLQRVQADAILYDPLINREAPYAGKLLGIPSVALLTVAGPGSGPKSMEVFLKASGYTQEGLLHIVDTYEPHLASIERLNKAYGLGLRARDGIDLLGYMPQLEHSMVTAITTSQDLQDSLPLVLAQAYQKNDVIFEAVGPLLDVEGSCRAAGHKYHQESGSAGASQGSDSDFLSTHAQIMVAVRDACLSDRPVVLVSMGTVITGDSCFGWSARDPSTDGIQRGLSGRELCQSAWRGAIDAFGCTKPLEGALLLLALGPQPDALDGLELPANCLASPSLPQVDILKAGVKVFLTHGGQNSFTEGLANGVPLVVCPGFGDQVENASKAERIGVGRQVARPHPESDALACAIAQYRADVAQALQEVFSDQSFSSAAVCCMQRLQRAGGVPRMVEIMLDAAAVGEHKRQATEASPTVSKQSAGDCPRRSPTAAAVAGA